jgi:hypothetical protein
MLMAVMCEMIVCRCQRLVATEASALHAHAIHIVKDTNCQCFCPQVYNGIHQQIEQHRATVHSNTERMTAMRSEMSAMDREVRTLNAR